MLKKYSHFSFLLFIEKHKVFGSRRTSRYMTNCDAMTMK